MSRRGEHGRMERLSQVPRPGKGQGIVLPPGAQKTGADSPTLLLPDGQGGVQQVMAPHQAVLMAHMTICEQAGALTEMLVFQGKAIDATRLEVAEKDQALDRLQVHFDAAELLLEQAGGILQQGDLPLPVMDINQIRDWCAAYKSYQEARAKKVQHPPAEASTDVGAP